MSQHIKFVNETLSINFDFLSLLELGETLGSAVVTADVFSGTDGVPAAIISGSPSLSGTIVSQLITDGSVGVTYIIICAVTTSLSQEFILTELVSVLSTNPF